jgi:hypothetical protein
MVLCPAVYAYGGSCSNIVFNCDKHVASVGNVRGALDCGVSTPRHHNGRIGARGKALGTRWKCLKGKPKVDLGLGPVIVHTPCGGRSPKGQNQHFSGSGCMNVNKNVMAALESCRNAPYQIQYASKNDSRNYQHYASRRNARSTRQAQQTQPSAPWIFAGFFGGEAQQ